MDIVWKILATLGLVALNAYFVAVEFAAVGARRSRLEVNAPHSLTARLALLVKDRLDLYLSSCQLGVTLASLALGAVTEPAVVAVLSPVLNLLGFHPGHGAVMFAIALGFSTSLHIVIGEQAPKNWAISYSDRLLPLLTLPLILFTYLFYPLIWLLNVATNGVLRLTGVKSNLGAEGAVPHTEQELRALVTQAVAGGTIPKGREMILTSAFDFGDLKVRQIMKPRTEVDYLTLDQPIGDVLRVVQKSAYTRLPLCDGDIDHVIGLVQIMDFFAHVNLVRGMLGLVFDMRGGG